MSSRTATETWNYSPLQQQITTLKNVAAWAGLGPDVLCKRATASVCDKYDPQALQCDCSWIPSHMPRLESAEPLFIATCVLGVVSRYSNAAWDDQFLSVEKLTAWLDQSLILEPIPERSASALALVGLFPLLPIFPEELHHKIATKYSGMLTNSPRVLHSDEEPPGYSCSVEIVTRGRSKHGEEFSILLSIECVFESYGGLLTRQIRCVPMHASCTI